jgi:hypothetical protein
VSRLGDLEKYKIYECYKEILGRSRVGEGRFGGDIRRSGENEGRSSEIRARCKKILGEYRVIERAIHVRYKEISERYR